MLWNIKSFRISDLFSKCFRLMRIMIPCHVFKKKRLVFPLKLSFVSVNLGKFCNINKPSRVFWIICNAAESIFHQGFVSICSGLSNILWHSRLFFKLFSLLFIKIPNIIKPQPHQKTPKICWKDGFNWLYDFITNEKLSWVHHQWESLQSSLTFHLSSFKIKAEFA